MNFQQIILKLNQYWEKQGCLLVHSYDIEKGAGTFNPATFLRSLGPEPFKAAYIEPCRRPTDGRYGENPNRLQHYFQYQVMLKPSPQNIKELYLKSLKEIGLNLNNHDIRFVHDDWESPTLAAWGLGWEVWIDGMEMTQFTYFQQVGEQKLKPITGEITYGLERIAMYLQKVESVYDICYNDDYSYGDIFHQNEIYFSKYNFEQAEVRRYFDFFNSYKSECENLISAENYLVAYEMVMKCSHVFNLLDARNAISVTERAGYIEKIRTLAKEVAKGYLQQREQLGFPLLKKNTNL